LAVLHAVDTGSPIVGGPIVADGSVFVGNTGGALYIVDETEGNVVWAHSTGGACTETPAYSDQIVVFPVGTSLFAVQTSGAPRILWSITTDLPLGSPTISDGLVFVTGGEPATSTIVPMAGHQVLYCLDLHGNSDGTQGDSTGVDADMLWQKELPGLGPLKRVGGNAAPAIYGDVLYVTSDILLDVHIPLPNGGDIGLNPGYPVIRTFTIDGSNTAPLEVDAYSYRLALLLPFYGNFKARAPITLLDGKALNIYGPDPIGDTLAIDTPVALSCLDVVSESGLFGEELWRNTRSHNSNKARLEISPSVSDAGPGYVIYGGRPGGTQLFNDGIIFCDDLSGEEQWTFAPEWLGSVTASSAIAVDQAIVCDLAGNIVILPLDDPNTDGWISDSEVIARVELDAPIRSHPATANGRIYCGADNGILYCVGPTPPAQPQVSRVTPSVGSTTGGTRVSIQGDGFLDEKGQGQVLFGPVEAAAYERWSNTEVVCVTPPSGSGAADISVTTDSNRRAVLPSGFMYQASKPGVPANLRWSPSSSADGFLSASWGAVPAAIRYGIQITEGDPTFSGSPMVSEWFEARQSYSFQAPGDGDYYFRVRAFNGDRLSDWSGSSPAGHVAIVHPDRTFYHGQMFTSTDRIQHPDSTEQHPIFRELLPVFPLRVQWIQVITANEERIGVRIWDTFPDADGHGTETRNVYPFRLEHFDKANVSIFATAIDRWVTLYICRPASIPIVDSTSIAVQAGSQRTVDLDIGAEINHVFIGGEARHWVTNPVFRNHPDAVELELDGSPRKVQLTLAPPIGAGAKTVDISAVVISNDDNAHVMRLATVTTTAATWPDPWIDPPIPSAVADVGQPITLDLAPHKHDDVDPPSQLTWGVQGDGGLDAAVDGDTVTLTPPSSLTGSVPVVFTLTNSHGRSVSQSSTMTWRGGVLEAAFEYTVLSDGLTVAFRDRSVGGVTTWSWDFGDGGTSVEQHPTHKYGSRQPYTVTLTVSGPSASAHVSRPVSLSVPRPMGQIAFLSNRSGAYAVYIHDVATGILTPDTGLPGTPYGPASLSPDGRQVAYASVRDGVRGIYIAEVGSNDPAELVIAHANIGIPTWSPDGATLAFESHESSWDIYTISADARNAGIGQARNVTMSAEHENQPSWSPDGSQILYVWHATSGPHEIVIHDVLGSSAPTHISIASETPVMSPDGTQIAFEAGHDIRVLDLVQQTERNLTNSPHTDTSPNWSPDGTQITYTSTQDGSPDIFIMSAVDGAQKTNISNSPGSTDASSVWIAGSPIVDPPVVALETESLQGYSITRDGLWSGGLGESTGELGVTASGFAPNVPLTIQISDRGSVTRTYTAASSDGRTDGGVGIVTDDDAPIQSDANGNMAVSLVLVDMAYGEKVVEVVNAESPSQGGTATFSIEPEIVVYAVDGNSPRANNLGQSTLGKSVSVFGLGFADSGAAEVELTVGDQVVSRAGVASDGTFDLSFALPFGASDAIEGGPHVLRFTGALGETASEIFTVLPRLSVIAQADSSSVLSTADVTVPSGEILELRGDGFTAATAVTFRMGTSGTALIPTTVLDNMTDGRGRIEAARWEATQFPPDGARRIVRAITPAASVDSTNGFIVTPPRHISAEPTRAKLGSTVAVTGVGFGAEETVTVAIDGQDSAHVVTDGQGAFTTVVSLQIARPHGSTVVLSASSPSVMVPQSAEVTYDSVADAQDLTVSPTIVVYEATVAVSASIETGATATFSIAGVDAATAVEMTATGEDAPDGFIAVSGSHTAAAGEDIEDARVTVGATDALGNVTVYAADTTVTIRAQVTTSFTVALHAGVNLLHVPVKVGGLDNASDLYDTLGGSDDVGLIVMLNDAGKFVAFTSGVEPGSPADVALADGSGAIVVMKKSKPVTFTGGLLITDVSLSQGINVIGAPRAGAVATAGAIADLSTDVQRVIREENGRFVAVVSEATDAAVTGGAAYIVLASADATLTLDGGAWKNSAAAAPITNVAYNTDASPVFLVQGSLVREDTLDVVNGIKVTVTNMRTGDTLTDTVGRSSGSGRFATTFLSLGGAEHKVGDTFDLRVVDPSGTFGGVRETQRIITREDMRSGRIDLGAILLSAVPERSTLLPNFPNPFNPETWIPFQLSEASVVTVSIYDAAGERTRTLELGYLPAGTYASRTKAAYWDGTNEIGERVASGVYLYELRAGAFRKTGRMVIQK
jgi:Tol biopolymer transport system component